LEDDVEVVSIRLENISKTFIHRIKGKISAVDQVSLFVEPGEFLTLLGPSGCGKTTTLRMVAGFERPDRGRIYIGKEDVTDLMANQRNIGFVFQNYALFPHLSVFENVAYGLKVKGASKIDIEKSVGDVLALVGLKGYDRQFPHQLSGGEQQRVALARAVVIQPRVLLFDEPLSNLDAKLRVYMRSEIRRLQKALSITAIYVTHDQEEAMAISDHIAVMNEGKIVQIGTAEELYLRPDSPFVARFIGKINILPAVVKEVTEEQVTLKIFKQNYQVAKGTHLLKPGQKVNVFIRPESVELTRGSDEGLLKALVTERTFLGEKVDYLLEIDGHPIYATSYDPLRHGTFPLHQEIGVRFNSNAITILKEVEK
jgi:ABC-type Fe3+/spermidine/putrescine transport system ATPase subunit